MSYKRIVLLFSAVWFFYSVCSQPAKPSKKSPVEDAFPAISIDIRNYLESFTDSIGQSVFRISLCADVPDNKKPLKVAHRQETGHVFLMLQKINPSGDTISKVFGFYPKRGLQTLLFKKTKSSIKDNSYRMYDARISKELSKEQFDTILVKAIDYANRKYHMNRYNCYDYAVAIFNSVAMEVSLPVTHVRFPFIFGKGGSPCSVYKDLRQLQVADTAFASNISFGEMVAPVSNGREKKNLAK